MENMWFLYTVDIILVSLLVYACCRKDTSKNNYVELPDDYEYDPEIVYAQELYNE